MAFERCYDLFGFGHAPLAAEAAGESAAPRLYDVVAERAQPFDVGHGRGVAHHVEIHCRSNPHRLFGRQISRHEHIVGNAVGHFPDCRGCGGSYDHSVGPQPEVDMAVPFAGVGGEKLADDGLLAQRSECHGRYELLRCRSHDNLNLGSGFCQQPQKRHALIGGNAARNAENDMFAFERAHFIDSFIRVKTSLVLPAKSPCIIQL